MEDVDTLLNFGELQNPVMGFKTSHFLFFTNI